MIYNKRNIIYILLLTLIGCSYSFTGASIPSHLHTLSIPIVKDRSGSGIADLKDKVTDKLIEDFLNDNSFSISNNSNADAELKCTIISFSDAPSTISTSESVSKRKVSLTIKVVYKDLVKRKTLLERNFSNFVEYNVDDGGGSLLDLRTNAMDDLIEIISDDILLAVVSNW